MATDIKELQQLIDRERVAQERVKKSREEAEAIVKQAREKAESIVNAAESDPSLEAVKRARYDEIARKKTEIEDEHKRKVSTLEKLAQENFEKAVDLVLKETLRGKL